MNDVHKPGIAPPPRPPAPEVNPRSLVLVNTGDGKGKSTAAFGVIMRAVARDWRVCVRHRDGDGQGAACIRPRHPRPPRHRFLR